MAHIFPSVFVGVKATALAFAALRGDGRVISWGPDSVWVKRWWCRLGKSGDSCMYWRKRKTVSGFLSGFDDFRDDSYYPTKHGGCTEISYPPAIISQGGKKRQTKKSGWQPTENTSNPNSQKSLPLLRFWRQQHFCSTPTGGGTTIF